MYFLKYIYEVVYLNYSDNILSRVILFFYYKIRKLNQIYALIITL